MAAAPKIVKDLQEREDARPPTPAAPAPPSLTEVAPELPFPSASPPAGELSGRTTVSLVMLQKERSIEIDGDFHGWLLEQVSALRDRNALTPDWENLAEELEAMGVSQRAELKERLYQLLLRLLKWQTQPKEREYLSRGWMLTIREQRRKITDLVEAARSLKHYLPNLLVGAWDWACEDAADDAPDYSFPVTCPWTYDDLMNRDFLPPASSESTSN
jgi:hypothetical protein